VASTLARPVGMGRRQGGGRGERRDGRWLGQQAKLVGCGGSRGRPREREGREPGHTREREEIAEQAGKGERNRPLV